MQNEFGELKLKLSTPLVLAIRNLEPPFVVEKDGSSILHGALLAQRKGDDKRYPIQYSTRTMISTERNYLECRREVLAVISKLKTF